MRRLLAAALATLALPALAFMPAGGAVANAGTVQPDGGGTGWTLVQNDDAQSIYDTWNNISGLGGEYCNNKGTVDYNSSTGYLELWTNGSVDGNCARMSSPWTIAPPAGGEAFIEYEAWLPQNTWAALWAEGDPGPWPTTGEIDTAEVLQNGLECSHYHYGTPSDPQTLGDAAALGTPNCATIPDEEWTYGVEWSAGQLKFYGDGINWDTFSSSVISTDPEQVVLDNKTGGFDQGPDGPTSVLQVSYVRAWTKS